MTTYCLVSGGRDSVVACHYYATQNKVKPILVHASTPLEDPANIEYVKEYAEWLGSRLIITKPKHGLEKILDWGLPGLRNRWCMRVWKQEPMREVIPRGSTIILGIRKLESNARARRYKFKFYNDRYYNAVLPILESQCKED
jgi:3'-phosphoadenosine 5'-phosphosulfate sulfotransferase (PAPS reductase)/FAD synthetase